MCRLEASENTSTNALKSAMKDLQEKLRQETVGISMLSTSSRYQDKSDELTLEVEKYKKEKELLSTKFDSMERLVRVCV